MLLIIGTMVMAQPPKLKANAKLIQPIPGDVWMGADSTLYIAIDTAVQQRLDFIQENIKNFSDPKWIEDRKQMFQDQLNVALEVYINSRVTEKQARSRQIDLRQKGRIVLPKIKNK